ncbi:hypothetical protein, partial [Phocaeicola plebeius]|uniref:hypothetical protein n=1 Tax=Phocaeicola plebeius TaxID=310297 RepID=UPI0026F2360F
LCQELIFKLTTIFSTLQNAFAFNPKRTCVSSKTHLRLKANALAFFTRISLSIKKEGYTIQCIPPSIL